MKALNCNWTRPHKPHQWGASQGHPQPYACSGQTAGDQDETDTDLPDDGCAA